MSGTMCFNFSAACLGQVSLVKEVELTALLKCSLQTGSRECREWGKGAVLSSTVLQRGPGVLAYGTVRLSQESAALTPY